MGTKRCYRQGGEARPSCRRHGSSGAGHLCPGLQLHIRKSGGDEAPWARMGPSHRACCGGITPHIPQPWPPANLRERRSPAGGRPSPNPASTRPSGRSQPAAPPCGRTWPDTPGLRGCGARPRAPGGQSGPAQHFHPLATPSSCCCSLPSWDPGAENGDIRTSQNYRDECKDSILEFTEKD